MRWVTIFSFIAVAGEYASRVRLQLGLTTLALGASDSELANIRSDSHTIKTLRR